MKRIVTITAAALALTATAAVADPYAAYDEQAYVDRNAVAAQTDGGPGGYYEIDEGMPSAPGFSGQNDTQAKDWTPNTGAGTSRTSAANQG